ncbi:MAG: dTMP kinase [Candidatus Omnitrophica bacterium]|nr:dTMP kinase [Candidatus Omnitrophota bacterium]
MRRGLLITLEGPEGCGKSTHSRRLARWLKGRGFSVVLTREPGGTPLGRKLRSILLDQESLGLTPWMELLLYEASRAALVSGVILPALKAGKVVVVDRFQDSTWVYQGWAGGVDLEGVERLGRAACQGLEPHLTILLDLPVSRGLSRVARPNRMERKPVAFHRKVRQGYGVLARRHRRIRVIRTEAPVGEVQEKIRQVVERVLKINRE